VTGDGALSGPATVLFTDMVGSTELMVALGDITFDGLRGAPGGWSGRSSPVAAPRRRWSPSNGSVQAVAAEGMAQGLPFEESGEQVERVFAVFAAGVDVARMMAKRWAPVGLCCSLAMRHHSP
jgi:hypothetical protein